MRNLFNAICLWMAIVSSAFTSSAKTSAASATPPDFAFPKQVSERAEKDLKTAIKQGDATATVDAIVRLGLAQSAIDSDNLSVIVPRVETIAASANDSITSSLLYSLLAEIYRQAYASDRWTYDRRSLPALPLPDNLSAWSGDQFKTKITDCLDKAMRPANRLGQAKVTDYPTIITADSLSAAYYPTLLDFTANRAINIISDIYQGQTCRINAKWFDPDNLFVTHSTSFIVKPVATPLNLYQLLARFHAGDRLPALVNTLNRIDYTSHFVCQNYNKTLMDMADGYRGDRLQGLILAKLSQRVYTGSSIKDFIDMANDFTIRFPDDIYTPTLRQKVSYLTTQTVTVTAPSITSPGFPTSVTVKSHNALDCRLDLYRVQSTKRRRQYAKAELGKAEKIASFDVSFDNELPFTSSKEVEITLPSYGEYVINPVVPGIADNQGLLATIACTDIAINRISSAGNVTVVAANPVSGAPVEGVNLMSFSSKGTATVLATTGRDGTAVIPADKIGSDTYIYPIKGNDKASLSADVRDNKLPSERLAAHVLTDLPVYHPGDTIRAAAIAYNCHLDGNSPAAGQELTLTLTDTNGNKIKSIKSETDSYGRAQAAFASPTSGLTGSFSITANACGQTIGQTTATVSDYKLPTFEVTLKRDGDIDGDIEITGQATTFAGFPVADATVNAELLNDSGLVWFRSGNEMPFHSFSAVTGSDGSFTISMPRQLLGNAPYPDGMFTLKATVVSRTGESHDATTMFTSTLRYYVTADVAAATDATAKADFHVNVATSAGTKASIPVDISFTADGNNVATITATDGRDLDLSEIPSGRYKVVISPSDTTVSSRNASLSTVIYRPTDKLSPVNDLLWAPSKTATADAKTRKATVRYATSRPDTHIYYIGRGIATGSIISGWLTPKAGMNSLTIALPEGEERMALKMYTFRDLDEDNLSFTITSPLAQKSIKISVSTFRDNTVPGSLETLTLTVSDNQGKPAQAAVVLDVFNKALAQLKRHPFKAEFTTLYSPNFRSYTTMCQAERMSVGEDYCHVNQRSVSQPEFNLYGQAFLTDRIVTLRRYGTRMMSTAATDFHAETSDTRVYHANLMDPETDVVVYPAESDSDGDSDGDSGTDGDKIDTSNDTEYRDSEVPAALFSPMLTTDSQGRLNITYTVPDANATWLFKTLAYDDAMRSDYLTLQQIASKPLMVSPNPPRFLRTGDKVVIPANIMNATGSTLTASTRFEIFNPANGQTIACDTTTTVLAPGASAIAETRFSTPFTLPMVGYRIKATANGDGDGEQGLIPVLQSSQPVIESRPFYMPADSATISLSLPALPINGAMTLQVCENPTWLVVAALPGLRADVGRSSTSASASIFSAAVADGLLRTCPELKNVMRRWLSSDRSDSTLTSMLRLNADLKVALLQSTPWVNDADADTRRMNRLALLFDRAEIDNVYSSGIDLLAKSQRDNGGWSWTTDYTAASYWSTLTILEHMGQLKKMGYLPTDSRLTKMIESAVAYADKETARQFKKNPKADFTTYVAIRDLFDDIKQPTSAAKVTNATIQRLIADWKSLNVNGKAIAAIILNRHSYSATSRLILKSLNEYAAKSPEKGMWWPSLDNRDYMSRYSKMGTQSLLLEAYHTITPNAPEVDLIRQHLVIEKEATDWKDGVITTQVIASILTCGSRWTVPAQGITATIGGKELATSPSDNATGYIKRDITKLAKGGEELKIVKPGKYPSWGSVMTRGEMAMERIDPVSIPDLSISKSLYRATNHGDSITWETTNSYRLGDRLKVDLLITTARDMDYVVITDQRGACLEPVEQLPRPVVAERIYFYLENRDAVTNIFVDRLPKGTYHISYEMSVNNAGRFSAGAATIQSQYSPALTAHSSGEIINVETGR